MKSGAISPQQRRRGGMKKRKLKITVEIMKQSLLGQLSADTASLLEEHLHEPAVRTMENDALRQLAREYVRGEWPSHQYPSLHTILCSDSETLERARREVETGAAEDE